MRKLLMAVVYGFMLTCVSGVLAADENGDSSSQSVSDGQVKIGVLTDMSSVYKTNGGPGSVLAAKMAIEDFGGEVLGKPVKLISADHRNKSLLASSVARKWIDQENVDMITELANSAAALAVQKVASSKGTITMATNAGTAALTEDQCTKYGIHYTYDTHSTPVATATKIVEGGGDSWFFITADYEFGHSIQENAAKIVRDLGGEVVGNVYTPLGATDFASYLIQAKASGAEVIALANAGADLVNTIKQANAFNILDGGQQLAGLLVFLVDIKALGLEMTQGLQFTTAFYWNRTDASRKWSKRFFEQHGAMPTMNQAGTYSATLTYLKAVEKAGTDDARAVRKALGAMTIDDMFVQGGHIEPNGLMLHDMYLVQVKTPEESRGPWDLLNVVATIPGKDAYIPLSKSSCPLLDES